MKITGVWLPIITPFFEGELDIGSYRSLIQYYLNQGISGLIPLGTTGESPCISEKEFETLVAVSAEEVNGRIPLYIGLGGNNTSAVLQRLALLEQYRVDGILSVCPYYNRTSQEGLYNHFLKISEATGLNIMIYNIPHRTGVNLLNETLLKLAEEENIVAVKDCCGNIVQTLDLLRDKPENFSVLAGEDRLFYTMLASGGEGGVMASAHLNTGSFLRVWRLMENNDYRQALPIWRKTEFLIPLLFEEPSPAPIKYILEQQGLIRSCEVRAPLSGISDGLKDRLKNCFDLIRLRDTNSLERYG
jgi:4-hydroxy-tetrahydrodipicolinate synthase